MKKDTWPNYTRTAAERQNAAYENYMAQLREIWMREFDELIDLLSIPNKEEELIERIKEIPQEGIDIINLRCRAIAKHQSTDNTEPIKILSAGLSNMIVSIKRAEKLEQLGL